MFVSSIFQRNDPSTILEVQPSFCRDTLPLFLVFNFLVESICLLPGWRETSDPHEVRCTLLDGVAEEIWVR